MNKGLVYEHKVLKEVTQMIDSGRFGLVPSQAKVSHKPSYYSRDREKNIIFDVSVEVFMIDAVDPYFVWVWECKNYNHKVPVDDVEEFHSKLTQIGANRTKGTIITPKGFDDGALNFARSKGIGLWRYIPPEDPICVMNDSQVPRDSDIIRGLTTLETSSFKAFGIGLYYGMTCHGNFIVDPFEWIWNELVAEIPKTSS
ncbi:MULTISPECIES: restriction endonuclease [Cyanophyceae]|uniref:restriction endonuclease n=1 Tax=Cyanophyceae TaxID=3028117 RepID=UPI00168510A0|nr:MULTISPECIES: restriction endonuclease [Cyanophyceae]MBD1919312.1 restriction endonuclease [Phormidium sp. FACHB-77]MBD2033031.1 restriction endonuclease [Phormidium sp. FACHB-322]MBD2054219.1 restriction endonuclease [Leptolyngbya sp. FACHB-60]